MIIILRLYLFSYYLKHIVTYRALSDVDGDGRLSCEEFVLALYLCEQAKQGAKVPTVLPRDLIPPTQRRQRALSIQSTGSAGTPGADNAGN